MAVAMESFSIRDYAGRMRSVDIRRCWPFASGGDDAPPLPPISVRNFRWWADELDTARSAVVVEAEHCTGKGAAAPPADDIPRIPIEAAVAPPPVEEERRPSKGKQRTPKKRSILELFAAAPPIAVNELDEADSDDGERRAEVAKGAGNREGVAEEEDKIKLAVVMRKKKAIKENNVKRKKRRKKKKGIKEGLKVEICAWEKEKICKPKMLSSVQSHMFQNPICSKKIKKTAMSFVESQKKPTILKSVSKKHKSLQTSKLLPWNQEVPKKLPLRSILKNQKKSTSTKKSSKITSARVNLIKLYCESQRHVTFSVKDDMLGHSKACSSIDFPQLQNLCKIFSDVLAASSAINHSSKGHDLLNANGRPQVVNASEKESRADVIERTEASTSGKNHLSDSDVNVCQPTIVNSSNSSCSGAEKASFAVMVDLNHAIETSNDLDCFILDTSTVSPSCIYSGEPTCRGSVHTKDLNSASEILLEAGLPRASDASLLPMLHDKFVSSSDATSSLSVIKNPTSHSSTPCLVVHNEINEVQYQPHVGADVNFCRDREGHQSGSHSTPKGLLSSICNSMGSKRFGESVFTPGLVSTCKSNCIGGDFIGLPLNSQGELIQLSSGTKFPEKYNRKNMELGSRHGSSGHKLFESSGPVNYLEIMKKKVVGAASHQKNQLDWRQKQHCSTRERVRHWLNFSELEGSERLEHQNNGNLEDKDTFLHCNSNPTTGSFHEYKSHNVTHEFFDGVNLQGKCNVDYHVQPDVQPMMRLMGKNVVVGAINKECQGFDDGKTWRNKETFSEQTQLPTMPEKPLSKQWLQTESVTHATNGRSKGNLLERSDSSPNFCHMKAAESTFDYMSITQPQWLARNNVSSAIGNHTIKLDLNKHALPPHTFLNKATQFLGNCISGEGSVTIGRHYPSIVASQPQNVHQHMLLSSTHRKHSQRVSCCTSTATQPQIGYQNFQNLAHPPSIQPTAKLPQWLLHPNQQKRNQLSDSHYSNQTVIRQPCGVSGTNLNSHLFPYHVPVVPFSVQKNDPRKACSSFAPNACTPAYAPVVTTAKSNAEFENISIKKKERSVIHPKFSCFKGPVDAYMSKKRPVDSDNGIMNPIKRPTLKRQADLNGPARPRGIVQMNSYAILDKAISLNFQQTANGKGVCRNATGSSSLRFDSDSRPGPTKLIPGAKHILKPCQRMDDERCRPTHCTIIFPSNAAVVKFLSSEKKFANIYKF